MFSSVALVFEQDMRKAPTIRQSTLKNMLIESQAFSLLLSGSRRRSHSDGYRSLE